MKKIMPFIVFLCCFNTVLHAQLDTFNLSRYKLPDIKYRQLDLNFKLDGSNSFKNMKNDENLFEQSTFASNNYLNIGYRSYRNSERLQSEQDYRIGINPRFSNVKSDSGIMFKSSDLNSYIELNSVNRIYYQNKFFFDTPPRRGV